ncbi:MAG: M48 family metalloprotease [Desulfatibacillum sp.]|nr:M48 family metalloprotease [Desulfatibacillum sp.]
MKKAFALILGMAFLSIACTAPKVQPVDNANSQLADDEKRYWQETAKDQEILDKTGFILENPEVENYLQEVMDSLIAPGTTGNVYYKIKIIKDPAINALSFPNGVICIHTGMLARFENEAQLAAVMAHEAIHAKNRHGLAKWRDLKSRSAIYASMGLGSAGAYTGGLISAMGTLSLAYSVAGFSRELEQEADEQGFALMVQAGYAPGECVKAFKHLKQWAKENESKEPYFFGSHPALDDRITNFNRLVRQHRGNGQAGITNQEKYTAIIRELILLNASLNLDEGHFKFAEKEVRHYLELVPDSGAAHCLLGEICLERNEEGDLKKAGDFFLQAIKLSPAFAPSHRGLGTVYLKQDQCQSAKTCFEDYLALLPEARDKAYLDQYIEECAR